MRIAIVGGGTVDALFLQQEFQKEQFDYVVAADRGLEVLKQIAVQPDVMLGDYDSVSKSVYQYYKTCGVRDYIYPTHKDDTDMELALRHAMEWMQKQHAQGALIVYGATGTRIDHMLANISLLQQALVQSVPMELRDMHNRLRLCAGTMQITRVQQYGDYVSLLPVTESVRGVTLRGFRYPLEGGTLTRGTSLGVSNVIEAEMATIEIQDGLLLVIESKD